MGIPKLLLLYYKATVSHVATRKNSSQFYAIEEIKYFELHSSKMSC